MTQNASDFPVEEPETVRRRGRPVQMCQTAREALVLDCAVALLSEHRSEEVTMAEIARRAGMSKRTLYTLYASREELLGAGLQRMSCTLFRALKPDEQQASLEERLRILLTFNPKKEPPHVVIEMLRAVISAARTYPGMARALSRSGPGQVAGLLAAELRRAAESGELALDPEEVDGAAELLVDMVVGNAIPALLDPDRLPRDPEAQANRRDRAIRIFLNGLRPR